VSSLLNPLEDTIIRKIGNGSPRRLSATEFAGESLDLEAGLLQRAGAVDFLGGKTQFLRDGKLGGDAAASFGFAKAAGNEALELLLRLAPGNHQTIQIFVNAGFDQKSASKKAASRCAGPLPFGD